MSRFGLGLVATGLAVVAIAVAAAYFYERPTEVRVAVARDTDDYRLIDAAAQTMRVSNEDIRIRIVPEVDAAASADSIDSGQADFAVVRSDIDLPKNGATAVIFRHSGALIVAPAHSDLAAIPDLKGHRVGILSGVPGAAANQRLLETILSQYDIPGSAIEEVALTLPEIAAAISTKRVDAVFGVGVPSTGAMADMVTAIAAAGGDEPVFLPIPEAAAIAQRSPVYEVTHVTRGAFGGASPRPGADFDTLGVSTRLIAANSESDDIVGEMTRFLFAKRLTIAASVPIANRMEAPSTDKGSMLPVHSGAAAFIDDKQESFFDKYSDAIYIGAMVLSGLGSSIAALASRLKARTTERADEFIHRLIVLLQQARVAESAEALDGLEREGDQILGDALGGDGLRSLDSRRVAAIGVAIGQVRLAIRDRRHYFMPAEAPMSAFLIEERQIVASR